MTAYKRDTDTVIKAGDWIKDLRGNQFQFVTVTKQRKIIARPQGRTAIDKQFYPEVFPNVEVRAI